LVLTKGAELELRFTSPGIDQLFGEIIHETCGHLGVYGLILDDDFGLFQVKCDFRREADLELIRFSNINQLQLSATRYSSIGELLNYTHLLQLLKNSSAILNRWVP